nr:M64 family metallopeptidase [uncultured Flavobacterium sp.]
MKFIFTAISILYFGIALGQNFEEYFYNKSLRFDFVFEGNKKQTQVTLQPLVQTDQWHGRTVNLNQNNLQGDAQINVIDIKSKKIIYTQSFSSLYMEWLTLKQADSQVFKTEQVLYIPYPKNKFKVEMYFFNNNKPQKAYEQVFNLVEKNVTTLPKANPAFTVLNKATNTKSPINVAIVAEGFKNNEMDTFTKYAQKTVAVLFKHQAFAKHKDAFNIYAVYTESKDSGVSSLTTNEYKNTVAQSSFGTFNSERYLTTSKLFHLHDQLTGIHYDHLIIIANTDVYGGGGIYNAYTLTSTFDKTFDQVVVHEFGHSFAGLGDEYFYENDVFSDAAKHNQVEPWVKNNTTLVDFDSKWKSKLEENTPIPTPYTNDKTDRVGVYLGIENGKVYIPHQDCRMHTNTATQFCSVCSDAIEELILHYTQQK